MPTAPYSGKSEFAETEFDHHAQSNENEEKTED